MKTKNLRCYADVIFQLCAALVNLQFPLIKEVFLPSTNKICDRSKSVGLIHIQNLLFYRIAFSK